MKKEFRFFRFREKNLEYRSGCTRDRIKKCAGKAVIAANLYGTPAKLDEIVELCEKYGAVLIEDAVDSLSATYKGKQTGPLVNIMQLPLMGITSLRRKGRELICNK